MFFPSTITLNPAISEDEFHKITYGTSYSLPCKYAKKNQNVKNNYGKDVFSKAWLQFPVGSLVNEKDQIILPDSDSTTGNIVLVKPIHYPNSGNLMCIEAYMGA